MNTSIQHANYVSFSGIHLKLFIAVIIAALSAAPADAKTKAGIVIMTSGELTATDSDNQQRTLQRRSEIFIGETLSTGDNSTAQIRFIDNAVISLRASTSIRIDNYQFADKNSSTENGVISLLKGGFRTITGAIQKENYQINTSVASIGIRGTEYEANFAPHGLDVAVWNGGILVKNQGGELKLGLGEKFNFATITSLITAPRGLLTPPDSLLPRNNPSFSRKATQRAQQFSSPAETPEAFTKDTSVFNRRLRTSNNLPPINLVNLATQTDTSNSSATSSSRDLSAVTLDRVGLVVIGGPNKPKFFGGRAADNQTGSPIISDNGYGPGDGLPFLNAPANVAFWRDNAITTPVGANTTIIANKEVSWGKWNGQPDPPSIMQVDPLGSSIEFAIDTPVYWITAQATSPLVVSTLTNPSATYESTVAIFGSGSGGIINTGGVSMLVDFSTGAVTGNIFFDTQFPLESWNVDLSGTIVANALDMTIQPSSTVVHTGGSITDPVTGDVPAIFTGDFAEGIVGALNLESANDPAIHAEGVFIVTQ